MFVVCDYAYATSGFDFKKPLDIISKGSLGVILFQEDLGPCGLIVEDLQGSHVDTSLFEERIREDFARNNIQECDLVQTQKDEIEFAIQRVVEGSTVQVASVGPMLKVASKGAFLGGFAGCILGAAMGKASNVSTSSPKASLPIALGGVILSATGFHYGKYKLFPSASKQLFSVTKSGAVATTVGVVFFVGGIRACIELFL